MRDTTRKSMRDTTIGCIKNTTGERQPGTLWLYFLGCIFLVVLSWLYYFGCIILVVLSWLYFLGCILLSLVDNQRVRDTIKESIRGTTRVYERYNKRV